MKINEQNLNDFNISSELLDWLIKNAAKNSTILEFGSGTGTIELCKFFKVYSVEQSGHYLNLAKESNYIHAPLVNNWYDPEKVFNNLPESYDIIIVDGPAGAQSRYGIDKYWDKLNTNIPIIFDDTHRESDRNHAINVSKLLNKEYEEFFGHEKNFIVLK